jgi:hypothetical protein
MEANPPPKVSSSDLAPNRLILYVKELLEDRAQVLPVKGTPIKLISLQSFNNNCSPFPMQPPLKILKA